MNNNLKATIVTIGDELLIGQTVDTNSAWIGQQLNALGIEVLRRVAVGDTSRAILEAIQTELESVSLLIITGGLGPTADDITKPVLCQAFGGKLVVHEATLAHVRSIFKKRKRAILDRNLRQAEVPDNCTVLPNAMGTAPGMWFEQDQKIIIALPGVPYEMMHIMEEQALPKIRATLTSGAVVHRTILTAGEAESFIAEKLEPLESILPSHIKLAYLPQAGVVRLRLTGHGTDELALINEIELRRDEMALLLEEIVVSFEDLPLEHIVGKDLVGMGKTLGLAESCTGGYIAHRLTQIMGAAQYLVGGIVSYQTNVKENVLGVKKKTVDKHCVVSEAVAIEMAEGACKVFESDIGFGITGLLSGGGEDEVPVGTVCMAASDGKRSSSATFHFHVDRIRNKELAAQHGLLFIWKFINGKI